MVRMDLGRDQAYRLKTPVSPAERLERPAKIRSSPKPSKNHSLVTLISLFFFVCFDQSLLHLTILGLTWYPALFSYTVIILAHSAIANYYRLGGLNNINFIFHSLRGWGVQGKSIVQFSPWVRALFLAFS